MYRPLGKVPLWLIPDLFCKSKSLQHGKVNIVGELGFCRSICTSTGNVFFGYEEKSTKKFIQKQIVDALYLGERGRASNLLLDLCHANNSLIADDFADILKYCATSADPLFAMETWKIMEGKGIGLNDRSCLFMMLALCKKGYLGEAFNLINFVGEKHGMNPSLDAYNIFLGACLKMCSIIHANQCLDLMERKMLGKNEVTYIQLLKLSVYQQDLPAVHEIWKDYIKYYSPSVLTLQKFLKSFAKLRDLNSAFQTLQYMVDLALRGRIYSSRLDIPIPSNVELGLPRFDLKDNNEQSGPLKVDACASNKEWSTLTNTGKEFENVGRVVLGKVKYLPSTEVLKSSFGEVIYVCAQHKRYGLAEQLMLQMQNLGMQPSRHAYNGFLRAVISERGIREGMEVLKIMQERKLKPYNSTFAILSTTCCKAFELDLAEAFLDQISNYQNPFPYNVFLEACDTMDQPERAIPIWAKIKKLKIQPNIRTYELLISLFGNVNAPYEDGNMLSQVDSAKRIKAIEMDMAKNGVQHNHKSMEKLLKALGSEGMIRELIQYLHVAENLFSCSNSYLGTPICNTVLHSLVDAKESQLAIEIFRNMKSSGLLLNVATYTTMIDCCNIIRCYKSACAVVSMMIRSGFYPQIAAYTALIKVLLEDGNFDEASSLLGKGSSEGIEPDVLLYNTFLRKAKEKGRIDIIELIVELMHREKIQPDAMTCHCVFSTYVERDFHSTAMEALQVLSMRMICEDNHAFQERKAKLEDEYILSDDQEAEMRILKLFVGPEQNIAVALLNLRWCAILGFPISWSPDETLWARRLSTNYDNMQRIRNRY